MVDEERIRRLVEREAGEEGSAGEEGGADGEAAVQQRLAALEDLDARATVGMDADLATLEAVADPTRYHALRLLVADGELTVGELVAVLDVSQSAVSHALGDLQDAGLVARRSEGTWRYYRATDAAAALVDALAGLRD